MENSKLNLQNREYLLIIENIQAKSKISSFPNFPSTKNIQDHDQLDTLEPKIKIKH